MDEKLIHILEHVARLSGQNPEFRRALCEKLRIKEVASASAPTKVGEAKPVPVMEKADARKELPSDALAALRVLRSTLQLRGRPSVDYGFVTDSRVRDQLVVDNLRMENTALMTKRDLLLVPRERRSDDDEALLAEHTRLDLFAIAAFNQLESLANWFFVWSYTNIKDIVEAIEDATKTSEYPYKAPAVGGKGYPDSVEGVSMYYKMGALIEMLDLHDVKDKLSYLRSHRNHCIHRGDTVKEEAVEKFRLYNNFGTVRTLLNRVVDAVRKDVAEQLRIEAEEHDAERRKQIERGIHSAQVAQNFSGYCQLNVDEVGKMTVPAALLTKVVKLKMGDSVRVTVKSGVIVDVEPPAC